jgi:two-component system phosphate regulon sensor histidine kinase PhoR
MGSTLAGRVFATVAAILAAVLGAVALWGGMRIRDFHRAEVERRLDMGIDHLSGRAREILANPAGGAASSEVLRPFARENGFRVTVIAADGNVLADTDAVLPLADHGGRPEVVEARAEGRGASVRRSDTVGTDLIYVARRLDGGGAPLGFLRVAATLERADAEVATLRRALLLGGLAALLLGVAASWLLARRIAAPLLEMERTAASLAAGDLGRRAPAAGPDEVRRLAGSLNRMADDLGTRIESEKRSREELEAVLAGMAEGVVAVDARERVVLMNAGAAGLLGLAGPLAPGAALWQAVRFPDLESSLRAAMAGALPERRDAASPSRDGRILALSVAPLGEGRGAVALLRDVTEVRRLEQVRMDFVANVSHELRTPLAAVLGALETLESEEDPEAKARFLDIGRRNAGRLQAIVADLLDLSSIEAEGERMPREPVAVGAPLRAAAAALAGAAEKKRVSLAVEAGDGAGPTVLGNVQRLEQAFTNLLENALKYTPAGGRVTARVIARGGEACVEVEDTGIGIPAESLPRIFERFYRVDRSRSREMGGTGLGLAIVKHVVRAHGGRVEVRSEEGRGTLFTVILPAAAGSGA